MSLPPIVGRGGGRASVSAANPEEHPAYVSERERQQAASAPPGSVLTDPVRKARTKPVMKRIPRSMLALKPVSKPPAAGGAGPTAAEASGALVPTSTVDGSFASAGELAGSDATGFLKGDQSSMIIPKEALERWQHSVAQEAARFQSVATYCDVTLQKVIAETRGQPQPCPLRVAVVCMLLDRLVAAAGPQRSVLAKLHDELFNAIFTGWSDYRDRKVAAVRKLEDTGEQPPSVQFDRDADAAVGTSHSAINAGNLFQRQTYFQALADLSERRMEVIGRPVRVLTYVLDLWRLKIEAIVFGCWRGHVDKVVSVRKRAAAYTIRKRCIKDRNRLEAHFGAWRTYVFERRHQCRVVYEEQTRVKLVHRMGRRITALEEENAALKQRYEKLFDEYCDVASRVTSMETLWKQFKRKIAGRPADVDTDEDADDGTAAGASRDPHAASMTVGPDGAAASNRSGPGGQSVRDREDDDVGDDEGAPPSPARLVEQFEREAREEANDYLVDKAEQEYEALQAAGREAEGRPKKRGPGAPKAAQLAGSETKAAPTGRVGQLAQFLDGITAEATGANANDNAAAADAASPDKSGRGRKSSKSPSKRKAGASGSPDARSPDASASAVGALTPSAVAPTLDYRAVLEWVTSRVQLFMTEKAVMRRCANFTVDFKDSTRLAYLLMSLGADRTLADEVLATKKPLERAELVCDAARAFNPPKPLEALDVAKGKGAAIAGFLFHMYAHYSHVPLVLPNASLNPRLMAQLGASASPDLAAGSPGNRSFAAVPPTPKAGGAPGTQGTPNALGAQGTPPLNPTAEAAAKDALATLTGGNAGSASLDEDAEPLPDRQYVVWYKELAADDSETDDVEEYVDVLAKKRGAMDELAARLSQRTEVSRLRTETSLETTGSPSHRKKKASQAVTRGPIKSEATVIKEHAARTKVRLVKWLADTINPLGAPTDPEEAAEDKARHLPGGEAGDAVAAATFKSPMEMSNADLVDALTRTLLPDAKPLRAPTEDEARAQRLKLKQLEQRLHQLRLSKVRLRQPQGAKPHDNVISLQQLVTALYVMNVDDPVLIV